ncbi:NAD(P)/FAD-dependent oxidoreductase [Streptomyces sp. CAI-121]|nr:NAD(P)/FAD-dependent oxidoreductase [Streptomyces sp. CAI-121]NUV98724.1 NAD(P)/FAD-dependent oxidoreductase [Streptomyces sp. CAI 127]NUW14909.1 NAD(P)/FAD-dependent oxidoreductase [Streptomyces sp. CAI-68]
MSKALDVVVIGGGQSGLAAGYHLRRLGGLDFAVLDAQPAPGGAWQHTWDSLRLFSPAAYSSLPGRLMPPQQGETYPDAAHVVDYLTHYEQRYGLPVQRPVRVEAVRRDGEYLRVETDSGVRRARAVVSATGTWSRPFLPSVPGRDSFLGRQLHTVEYRTPGEFAGMRVIVVGGGNSGAQIAADLAYDTDLTWVTQRPARFLADDIDGRVLFDHATARRRALDEGRPPRPTRATRSARTHPHPGDSSSRRAPPPSARVRRLDRAGLGDPCRRRPSRTRSRAVRRIPPALTWRG